MLDLHLGGKTTKVQQKEHIWKLLHPYITLINLYQNPHTYYPILVPFNFIFTNQSNLVVNCGTHFTLSTKYHHQTIDSKFNLNTEYPPAYEQLVWDYKKANDESIKKSIGSVNWKTLFNNKTVNKQVSVFNETIINFFFKFCFQQTCYI